MLTPDYIAYLENLPCNRAARQSDRRVDYSKWLSTLFSAAVWRKGAAVSDCVVSVEVGRRMASAVPHASPASD